MTHVKASPADAPATGIRYRDAPRRAPLQRTLTIIRTVLLDIAAAAGSICIILVILAFAFHITLIMFRTGSMAPAIPTGSLAIVKQIPASEAHVGDVVTVDRPQQLPVTHRVVAVMPQAGGAAVLQLKGDANLAPDPDSYRVTTVRLVIWSAPGLARLIVWLAQPLVIGCITLAVAALVTWSLWPQRGSDASPPAPPQASLPASPPAPPPESGAA
ncbi:MAG TPA: signal peptidase I [Gryllotalpicola sp.]